MNKIIIASAVAIAMAFVSCAKEKIERIVVPTPEKAVEIFINGMLQEDADAMLSVTGRLDGSALDDATYIQVRDEMNNAKSDAPQELYIKSFKVVGTQIFENVAQCSVEVVYSNDSTSIEENTLIQGADGGWRLPFFE